MVDGDDADSSDDDDDNTHGDDNNTEEKNDENLDRTDEDINDNESDCSSETLRRRYVFAKNGGNLLNTDIFFSVKNGEIDDLRLEPTDEELFRLRKDLDEVKIDAESLDEVDNDITMILGMTRMLTMIKMVMTMILMLTIMKLIIQEKPCQYITVILIAVLYSIIYLVVQLLKC